MLPKLGDASFALLYYRQLFISYAYQKGVQPMLCKNDLISSSEQNGNLYYLRSRDISTVFYRVVK